MDWWNSHPTAAIRSRGGLDEYQSVEVRRSLRSRGSPGVLASQDAHPA